jgi:hypothetical protein
MVYWETRLRHELTAAYQTEVAASIKARHERIEQHRPKPPEWFRTGAVEESFAVASPVVATFAHMLVHMPEGLAPEKISTAFYLARGIESTALRAKEDAPIEARRLAVLIDATVRSFLSAIYAAEGCEGEAHLLRQLPPLHTLRAMLIATKVVVGMLEGELKNVSQRTPLTHHLMVSVLRPTASLFVAFDYLIRALRRGQKIPPNAMVDIVTRSFAVFVIARKSPTFQETMDDYALAVVNMLIYTDNSLLPDLNVLAEPVN